MVDHEWGEVEGKIRALCEQVERLRYEVWSALEDTGDVNALQRCADISWAQYEEANRLWYTCPDHSYYYRPAGRQTMHALTRAGCDAVHISGALRRVVTGEHDIDCNCKKCIEAL